MAAVALSLLAGTTAATVLAIVARGEAHRASAAQRQAEWLLYASELAHHQREWDSNNLREAWLHLDRTPVALRGWEYRYCRALFGANHEIIGSGSGRINTIHFAPGGQRLVSGGGDPLAPSKPGKVCVWNTQTGKELLTLEGHTGPVWSVCFSPDGTHFAAAGEDGIVLVWDAEGKGKPLRLEGPRAVHAVSFSPDSKRLATADDDRAVRLWDASSGQLVGTFKGPEGHTNVVTSVCFTPDGRHLLSASDDKTLLWDIDPPRAKPVTLIGHISCVTSVCLSPDGKRLASTSGDSLAPDKAGEIRIWEWGAKAWRSLYLDGACRSCMERVLQPKRPTPGQRRRGRDGPRLGRRGRAAIPPPQRPLGRCDQRVLRRRRDSPRQRGSRWDHPPLGNRSSPGTPGFQ